MPRGHRARGRSLANVCLTARTAQGCGRSLGRTGSAHRVSPAPLPREQQRRGRPLAPGAARCGAPPSARLARTEAPTVHSARPPLRLRGGGVGRAGRGGRRPRLQMRRAVTFGTRVMREADLGPARSLSPAGSRHGGVGKTFRRLPNGETSARAASAGDTCRPSPCQVRGEPRAGGGGPAGGHGDDDAAGCRPRVWFAPRDGEATVRDQSHPPPTESGAAYRTATPRFRGGTRGRVASRAASPDALRPGAPRHPERGRHLPSLSPALGARAASPQTAGALRPRSPQASRSPCLALSCPAPGPGASPCPPAPAVFSVAGAPPPVSPRSPLLTASAPWFGDTRL